MLLPKRIFFLLFSILFLCSSASANFDSAFKLYEKSKFAEAFYAFKNLAYIGDKSSQFNLGVMYFRGEHVQSDPVEAYAWIVVAAEGGDESFLKTKKIIFGKFNEKEQVAAAGRADLYLNKYGREVLSRFWRHEIKLVQKAMGFRLPAEIHFDSIVLSDEAAQKKLLMDLADRDIISQETLLERFREIPNIERVRVRREERERTNDSAAPKKASPYHNPQHKNDIAKIALTKDILDPEYLDDIGLPYAEPAQTEEASPAVPEDSKNEPKLDNGRPPFSKDTQKRKEKRVLPRSSDATSKTMWAVEAQAKISEIVSPIALGHFGKKNVRSLNKAEVDQLEHLKLCILTGMQPFMDIDEGVIKELIDSKTKPSTAFYSLAESKKQDFVTNNQRDPNTSEMRFIYSATFGEMSNF